MKRILVRVALLLLAAVAAVLAWILGAWITHSIVALAILALIVFCATAFGLLTWMGRRDAARDPAAERTSRLRWVIGGALVYMITAQLAVGRQPVRTLSDPTPPAGLAFWVLRDSARVAYLHVPRTGERQGAPIVVLHDGPGIPFLPELAASGVGPLDFASQLGHDVYYYDQRGAGFSDRLDLREAKPYTLAQHVQDLEDIRIRLGAERLVLAGHGWGATLAANYMAAHPTHVEKALLLSPAPLWYRDQPEFVDPSARARLDDVEASALALLQRPPLRMVIGRLTATTSVRAAHTLVADWEADQWWTQGTRRAMQLGQPRMTCRDDPTWGLPALEGLGYFAYSYTIADALAQPDPAPALATNETPALIVRGLCDFVDGRVAQRYLNTLPGSLYVAIPGAGHLIWTEQQALFERVASAYLLDQEVPLVFYHPR